VEAEALARDDVDRPRRIRLPPALLDLPPIHDRAHRREDVLVGPGEPHFAFGRPRGRLRQGPGGDDRGRDTAAEQRELGGEADECPVYELYAYLLAGDDDELTKTVYSECVNGERLCGGCKEQAAELMSEFLEDHQEKRAEAEELLDDDLDIDLDSDRRGTGGEH